MLRSPPRGTEITRFASWSLRRTIRSAGAPQRDDAPVGLLASPRALKEEAESSQDLSVTAQRRSQSAARLIQQSRIASARHTRLDAGTLALDRASGLVVTYVT